MKWVDLRCPACNAVSYGPPDSKCKLGHRSRAMVKVDRAPPKKLTGGPLPDGDVIGPCKPTVRKPSVRSRAEEGKTIA